MEQVRKAREEQAAQLNFDLKAILADARKRQRDSSIRWCHLSLPTLFFFQADFRGIRIIRGLNTQLVLRIRARELGFDIHSYGVARSGFVLLRLQTLDEGEKVLLPRLQHQGFGSRGKLDEREQHLVEVELGKVPLDQSAAAKFLTLAAPIA